jgi:hypothetical protein
MLSPQQRRANDAVPPVRANDINGPPMLLPARTGPATHDSPRGNSSVTHIRYEFLQLGSNVPFPVEPAFLDEIGGGTGRTEISR